MNYQTLFLCSQKQNNCKTRTGQKFRRGEKFRLTPARRPSVQCYPFIQCAPFINMSLNVQHWLRQRHDSVPEGCQIGFFDAKYNKFGFFRDRWCKKNCWAVWLFSSMFGFFWRQFARAIRLRCLGFLKIFLKVLLAFLRECFVYFLKLHQATISPKHRIRSIQLLSLSLMFEHVALFLQAYIKN